MEIFSVLCGLVQSILILFNKKENWIFYMLNIVSLTIFSFFAHLYGDVLENSIYMLIGLLGTFTWYSKTVEQKIFGKLGNKMRYCFVSERICYIVLFIFITVVVYYWLLHTNDPQPFLDAITTGMGLIATWLMAIKRVDSWVIWFIDDILMAVVYFRLPERAIYLMSLNILWVVLAVFTFISWHKEAVKNKNLLEG